MSGERKRSVAAWPKQPRLSSTLPLPLLNASNRLEHPLIPRQPIIFAISRATYRSHARFLDQCGDTQTRRPSGRRAHACIWNGWLHAQTANDLLCTFVCSCVPVNQIGTHAVDRRVRNFALMHDGCLHLIPTLVLIGGSMPIADSSAPWKVTKSVRLAIMRSRVSVRLRRWLRAHIVHHQSIINLLRCRVVLLRG